MTDAEGVAERLRRRTRTDELRDRVRVYECGTHLHVGHDLPAQPGDPGPRSTPWRPRELVHHPVVPRAVLDRLGIAVPIMPPSAQR